MSRDTSLDHISHSVNHQGEELEEVSDPDSNGDGGNNTGRGGSEGGGTDAVKEGKEDSGADAGKDSNVDSRTCMSKDRDVDDNSNRRGTYKLLFKGITTRN